MDSNRDVLIVLPSPMRTTLESPDKVPPFGSNVTVCITSEDLSDIVTTLSLPMSMTKAPSENWSCVPSESVAFTSYSVKSSKSIVNRTV